MALLTAHDLRLERGGHDVVAGAAFTLSAERCVVVGAPQALFEAAVGVATPSGGTLDTHGHTLIHAGAVPVFPPKWTVLEWLGWRLRLAGVATQAGRDALATFGFAQHGLTLLGKAPLLVRKALPLVAALASTAPNPVIAFDDAFSDLDDEAAHLLASTLVRCAATVPWIAFLPFLSLRSPLAVAAAEVVVFDAGVVIAQGAPTELLAPERSYVVRVLGTTLPWAEKLQELGIHLASERPLSHPQGEGKELTVAFAGERGPRDLFALSADSADVIFELFPKSGKLV
jgi:hypothetical protein